MTTPEQREAVAQWLLERYGTENSRVEFYWHVADEVIAVYEAADPELAICEKCGKTYAECNAIALLRLEDDRERRLRALITERDQLRVELFDYRNLSKGLTS